MITGGTLFEELGFYYVGPVDGHNLDHLVPVLKNVRDAQGSRPDPDPCGDQEGPWLCAGRSVGRQISWRRQVRRGDRRPGQAQGQCAVLYRGVRQCADRRSQARRSLVAITAAMPAGTGPDKFAQAFPTRTFDVGIAEQHAVTFAAGLATEGFKPVCALYSTFLQRAYDQVVHDVAIEPLPVRFAIDRAVWWSGRRHPCRQLRHRLFGLPARHGDHVAVGRGRTDACGSNRRDSSMTAHPAFRYPRGDGTGVQLARARNRVAPSARAASSVKASKIALLSLGTRPRRA